MILTENESSVLECFGDDEGKHFITVLHEVSLTQEPLAETLGALVQKDQLRLIKVLGDLVWVKPMYPEVIG